MRPIVSPLSAGMEGSEVANLQEGLTLLLNRQLIQVPEDVRQELLARLVDEAQGQVYRNGTRKAVGMFQEQHHLPVTGAVDAVTAEALNATLRDLGAFNGPGNGPGNGPADGQKHVVAGQVVREDQAPFRGTVFLVQEGADGTVRLGEDLTDPEGRYTISFDAGAGADGARLRVTAFDADGKPGADQAFETGRPLVIVNLTVPRELPGYQVTGRVASPARAGVGGLPVVVVDRNAGPEVTLAQVVTADDGRYQAHFTYGGPKARPDLQARVVVGEKTLGASEVRYNAGAGETLDILLPESANAALASEHETLLAALSPHFQGNLRDLQETEERQDVTYLANKTGWDARAVAMAALSDQFSAASAEADGSVVEPAYYYALFRAGLPADPETLHRVAPDAVRRVWQAAAEGGLLPTPLAEAIPAVVDRFQAVSATKLLAGAARTGISSLGELLTTSRLNPDQQTQFSRLYVAHGDDPEALWGAATAEFGPDVARRLQTDGKLGFLTINNGPLMEAVHTSIGGEGLTDPLQLAQQGYYRSSRWGELLTEGVPVPKEIPGDSLAARRANYAQVLAEQVRLSYPTAAVAHMVRGGELPGAEEGVHDFLTEHQGRFEIGVQPVDQYLARNRIDAPGETVAQVRRLQRAYQITPSDRALTGLMARGMDAAYHVVRYDRDTFIETFGVDLGGAEHAAQTYDRSVQVHNAVLNIAVSYLTAKNGIPFGAIPAEVRQADGGPAGQAPPAGGAPGGQVLQPAPAPPAAEHAADVIAYPTLEGLFGSMDFCECQECRSVLSPAAYLVDLLLFLDQPHPPAGTKNPQTVLLDRRPDIQHLPLTCENTNTALPYIDLVNETLEYFVANGARRLSLQDYQGHDTGATESADLLASPQFAMDAAYATLQNEHFPPPLPFHRSLENLRCHLDKLEIPLPLLMERLRIGEELDRGIGAYGWRDILMEELRLSREEHEILTDIAAVPLARMYGFPEGTGDAEVIAALSNAKQFCRRLSIRYEELVALLKTRFVNPGSDLIPRLERLGVSFADLQKLKVGAITDAEFDALLPQGAAAPDPAQYAGDIHAWVRNETNFARIMGLITLYGPADANPSDFGLLELRYAKPPADANDLSTLLATVEFVRLLRFLRLQRKLGWTIPQTDAALCALFRSDFAPPVAEDLDSVEKLDAGFLTLLPRLGIVRRVMQALGLKPGRDLPLLLACWSEIGTHGEDALYRRMFLNPALLKADAVFAGDGYGAFIQSAGEKLPAHAEALRAAFNLSGAEFDQILQALGFEVAVEVPYDHGGESLDGAILAAAPGIGYDPVGHRLTYSGFLTATMRDALQAVPGAPAAFPAAVDALYAASLAAAPPLTLHNVSEIFRRGWLARKLKISVRELLLLIRLTGLNPFAAPDPAGPAMLRLIRLVQVLREQGVKSAAALYLVWNQDLSGRSAPDPAGMAELARTLRGDFAGIDAELSAAADPGGDVARAQTALVYGPEAAGILVALLDDTVTFDVPYTHPTAALEAAITAADARLAYDPFRHRLSHVGLLGAGVRDVLQALPEANPAFRDALDALFARGEDVKGSFFARRPELEPLYNSYVASLAPLEEKRAAFLAAFRPELARRRKREQLLARVSDRTGVAPEFAQRLLGAGAAQHPIHAAGQAGRAGLEDLLAAGESGLEAQFFYRNTASGAPDLTLAVSSLEYAPGAHSLPANPAAGAALSGIWRGQVEAPEAGYYNLLVEADVAATVTLSLAGTACPLLRSGNVWRNQDPLELRAGTLYDLVLTVENVRDTLSVMWETPKSARQVIPARYLYHPALLGPFSETYTRFLKSVSLAEALGLTPGELVYFALAPDTQIGGDGWLNLLPASGDAAPEVAEKLLHPLETLLDYARIKAELSLGRGDETLLEVLREPARSLANGSALSALLGWEPAALDPLLARFGCTIADLTRFGRLRQVHDALSVARRVGIPVPALLRLVTNRPDADDVRELQAALRARYDAADWRALVQPINDTLRGLQRDALVAYVLHQMRSNPATEHIDTTDKLFEYFLMDVQMEPCMQTSRIRHALSSLQLFIERCLMNLEPRVSPAALNAKQWEWMKRYRVWEANRKVFLWPENWLEPDLRDDKSPIFQEIETTLLQGDITEDAAASALLTYLSKLAEIAKLEPCGLFHVDADPARRTGEIDHVVARTPGPDRKYYYRRREYGYWTPWEQVKLEIEGTPVVPVVWQDRLLLFWLRILKESSVNPDEMQTSSDKGELAKTSMKSVTEQAKSRAQASAAVLARAVLCWSEYYNGKWQAARSSNLEDALPIGESDAVGDGVMDRLQLSLTAREEDGALRVTVGGHISGSFLLYNTHSVPVGDTSFRGGYHFERSRMIYTGSDLLMLHYDVGDGSISAAGLQPSTVRSRQVLRNKTPARAVEPCHLPVEPWDAPFFYLEESRNVFFVETAEEPVLLPNYPHYGVHFHPVPAGAVEIPPLVLQPEPKPRRKPRLGDGRQVFDPGVIDEAPARRLVTEDAYISRAIGTTARVVFGAKTIGPSGALSDGVER